MCLDLFFGIVLLCKQVHFLVASHVTHVTYCAIVSAALIVQSFRKSGAIMCNPISAGEKASYSNFLVRVSMEASKHSAKEIYAVLKT